MDSIASGYRPVKGPSEHGYGPSSSGSKCLYRLSDFSELWVSGKDHIFDEDKRNCN
jgi:hypothetical protein